MLRAAIIIVIVGIAAYLLRQFLSGGVCKDKTTLLDGKVVLITGANTGIGKETALDLAKRGAKVVMACRSLERGEQAAADIRKHLGNNVDLTVMKLDLASLKSVRQFAEEFRKKETKLDILINNAGLMIPPYHKTEDGFESQFGVNHLGHFLLTNLLLDLIKVAAPSRIINVSSMAHVWGTINFDDINSEKSYHWFGEAAYGQSKLANILFSLELSQRLEGTSITVNSLHPGAVETELLRHSSFITSKIMYYLTYWPLRFIQKTPEQGAQTTICCAVLPELENVTGKYFSDCREKEPASQAKDKEVAKKLWDLSEEMVGLKQ